MPNYEQNPALRPTILIHEIAQTVYRPTSLVLPPVRPEASEKRIAHETPRAA